MHEYSQIFIIYCINVYICVYYRIGIAYSCIIMQVFTCKGAVGVIPYHYNDINFPNTCKKDQEAYTLWLQRTLKK